MTGGDTNIKGWNFEARGTNAEKIIAAVLLLIPMVVFSVTVIYNFKSPEVLGVPFFYWFPILWLAVSSGLYVNAAWLLNRMEGDQNE